jgi:glucosamine--fructose-6-phosphate aminotransferase (isomerizing)
VPVVVLAPYDEVLFEKTISNMQEVKARGGAVIFISNRSQCEKLKNEVEAIIPMPETDGFIEPLLYSLAIQMLAYHTAVLLGRDVDQPRNLAKSVGE